jgi:hypothetical protein
MSAVGVRSFLADDRAAVRDISYRTGFMGESVESFWRYKESWADLWTSYYTDQEPQSLSVATMDDTVVGYLAGCMNTAAMTPSTDEIMQAVIRKHWLLFRPGTARFLYRGMLDTIRDRQRARGEFIDPRWPAHLHIDLLPVARGTGLGAALMERWLDLLEELIVGIAELIFRAKFAELTSRQLGARSRRYPQAAGRVVACSWAHSSA